MAARRCLAVLVLLLAAGCAGPSATHSSQKIGATGGSVTSADGALTLIVPAGALSKTTTITIDVTKTPFPTDAMTPVYTFGPAGLTLTTPALLTLVAESGPPAGRVPLLLDVDHRRLVDGSRYDASKRTFTGRLHHFSRYAGFAIYDPCAGKHCGDACTICASGDPSCTEPSGAKACDPNGACVVTGNGSSFSCSGTVTPYDPCAGRSCGDTCTICDPADTDCGETAVLKTCDDSGECVAQSEGASCTSPPYDPCAGKQCGDACTVCDPGDPNCVETAVLKTCGSDGTCDARDPACNALQWWKTCGDPVCGSFNPPAGMRKCTTETEGTACTSSGDTCYIDGNTCNMDLTCATTDPTSHGCPISRRSAKTNIDYLDDAALARYEKDLLGLKLTTFRYKNEPATGRLHLGFIIDDAPTSPAVLPNGAHVDLYGYTSMAVATLQLQAKHIAKLEAEVRRLERSVAKMQAGVCPAAARQRRR